jgi:hypothetical protein
LHGSQAGFDGRHHAVSGETDTKLTEADNFARTIARFLAESIDGEWEFLCYFSLGDIKPALMFSTS